MHALLMSAAIFGGMFDGGWDSWWHDSSQVHDEWRKLDSAHASILILQYAMVEGYHRYYPSGLSWAQSFPDREVQIPRTLGIAETLNMPLWLGLYFDESQWWGTPDSAWLALQAERSIAVIQELESLYGDSPVLRGYYLPQELARWYWQNPQDLGRLNRVFLAPVAAAVHATGKRLLAAPFFNAELETPQQFESFLDSLLNGFPVDILAVQDGVGAGHVNQAELGGYLRATQAACARHDVEYWVDVELFDTTGAAAPMERIAWQVDSAYASGAAQVVGYELYTLNQAGLLDSLVTWQLEREAITRIRTTYRHESLPLPIRSWDLLGRSLPAVR